jgi:two-component system response regulator AtoC
MLVLVVDDEIAVQQVTSATVRRGGYAVDTAGSVAEAEERLACGDYDLVLCDVRLPDGDGIELVRRMKAAGLDTHFVVMTAFASLETAVEALRAGAADYIIKPARAEELLHRLRQIDTLRGLRAENAALRRIVEGGAGRRFQFQSPVMAQVDRMVDKVAGTDFTVLITGESGTGKGVIARDIHDQSPRARHPFIVVNCGAIPEPLIEAELFGHTRGAFTGAVKSRKGLFVQADKGTIFLDEIGELPPPMQAKLLHVLEDRLVRPVGAEECRRVDVRIIAATNRNLPQMIEEARFREDLYFRLAAFTIEAPPLRARKDDIPALIRWTLQDLAGARPLPELDPAAEEVMCEYAWPGNVRELDNVLSSAYILADGDRITLADLPAMKRTLAAVSEGSETAREGGLRERLRRVEAELILAALRDCNGDRRLAAQRLGIGLSSLYRKLEEIDGDATAALAASGR